VRGWQARMLTQLNQTILKVTDQPPNTLSRVRGAAEAKAPRDRVPPPLRVLGLCTYPLEAAATRFRLTQFVEPLRMRGIEVDVSPFLGTDLFEALYAPGAFATKALRLGMPLLRRLFEFIGAGRYDLLLVQREAMLFGPPVVEWLLTNLRGLPLVLDLDDATYVHYESPRYGRLAQALKFLGKTDRLIQRADLVVCGNRFIAEHAAGLGATTVVLPTVVDTEVFRPRHGRRDSGMITLGWIGTHSTFPFLEMLFPVLERLALRHRFRLKVVGAGRRDVAVNGVAVECVEWRLDREVDDFRSLDIGLYPLAVTRSASEEWIRGKSGFKAIQYMAVGIPFVMSPLGVCAEMGVPGTTHFNASSDAMWYDALDRLLSDAQLRETMGAASRTYCLRNYTLPRHSDVLADRLFDVARRSGRREVGLHPRRPRLEP
jgi:glycosyltransferase involved in cell wall biosynthesis